jgi:hypothetical protein
MQVTTTVHSRHQDPQPQPNMATKLVGLEYDHPAFVSRLTLTVETCLQFLAAGAGNGVLSIACTGLIGPPLWDILSRYIPCRISQNIVIDLLINGQGSWKSFSSRVSRDYQLHYGNHPSPSRLLLLESLRLSGFFFSKWLLSRRTTTFSKPLRWMISDPSPLLSGFYAAVIFWLLSRMLPEVTAISSSSLTLPKLIARLVGVTAQVDIQMQQERLAAGVLRLVVPANTIAQYQYTAIRTPRTIRLLRIDSTRRTALCSLETVNLADAVDFWAVSYRWGSEEKPVALRITNGSNQDAGYIPMNTNCAAAVAALIPTGVRYLWIDAICINQDDLAEKALQVPLMGRIYSQASLVTGHLCTESQFSFGLLIHRMVQTFANEKKYNFDSGGSILIYRALSEFLQNDYFQRAWILQEMVLAKSFLLIHGKDCIYFDHLMMIANAQSKDKILPMGSKNGSFQTWLTGMPKGWKVQEWSQFILSIFAFRERATVIKKLRLSIQDTSQRLTVAEIVDHNMMFGAGNPRDQVYALLSLASDSAAEELQPNYDSEVSNKKIFTQISWYYLNNGNRLNLFLGAGVAPRFTESQTPRTPGLPSWVFDFAYGPARDFTLGNWAAHIERNRPAQLDCNLCPNHLSVSGTAIDKVAFIGPQLIHEGDVNFSATAWLTLMAKATVLLLDETQKMVEKSVSDPYQDGEAREEAYWRTMLMDRHCNQTPAPIEAKDLFLKFCNWKREMNSNPSTQPIDFSGLDGGPMEQRIRPGTDSIVASVTTIWIPYTFVVLESGYMGWAPHGVHVGDVFCLFNGCIVPFVLRPLADNNTFSLWGDGYVHGFMPGQKLGIGGRLKEWFNLV